MSITHQSDAAGLVQELVQGLHLRMVSKRG
jgi:hypothetical protein